MERFTAVVGALGFLGATAIVGYIAVARTGDPSVTALGALIALTSAGAGYFLRGKVQSAGTDTTEPGTTTVIMPPSVSSRAKDVAPELAR